MFQIFHIHLMQLSAWFRATIWYPLHMLFIVTVPHWLTTVSKWWELRQLTNTPLATNRGYLIELLAQAHYDERRGQLMTAWTNPTTGAPEQLFIIRFNVPAGLLRGTCFLVCRYTQHHVSEQYGALRRYVLRADTPIMLTDASYIQPGDNLLRMKMAHTDDMEMTSHISTEVIEDIELALTRWSMQGIQS